MVDILGLPGFIVIGIPSLQRYVDVFRAGVGAAAGGFLTVDDCERIVNGYGHPWQPVYLQPLKPFDVFQLMLGKCSKALEQPAGSAIMRRLVVGGMIAVFHNPTKEELNNYRRMFGSFVLEGGAVFREEISAW